MKKLTLLMALSFIFITMESKHMTTVPTITLHDKTFAQTISKEKIEARIQELGAQISTDYAGNNPIFICVLKGAFMFFSDLVKAVDGHRVECEVAFMQISSYQNATRSSGTIDVVQALQTDITDRDVIIVEDIVDTGLSMQTLRNHLLQSRPRSIAIATLFDKQLHDLDFPLDYVGFTIAPDFIVGYGLDYAQLGRTLPAIYTLIE